MIKISRAEFLREMKGHQLSLVSVVRNTLTVGEINHALKCTTHSYVRRITLTPVTCKETRMGSSGTLIPEILHTFSGRRTM